MGNSSSNAPAFLLYVSDFLTDEKVMTMTNQEVGCYIKLLCYSWREGSIPKDPDAQAKLCQETSSAYAQLRLSISKCFMESENDPERLVNPRLESERIRLEERRRERSESGRRGAEHREINKKAHPKKRDKLSISSAKAEPKLSISTRVENEDTINSSFSDTENDTSTAEIVSESDTQVILEPQQFCDLWNEMAGKTLGHVIKLTDARRQKIKTRLKEYAFQTPKVLIARILESNFLTGRSPQRDAKSTWRASFEWIIENETNAIKVLEGKYDNRGINGITPDHSTVGPNGKVLAPIAERIARNENAARVQAERDRADLLKFMKPETPDVN